jgi:hypothetical protein
MTTAQDFEDFSPLGSKVLKFIINNISDLSQEEIELKLSTLSTYVSDGLGSKIIHSSCGIHEEGKAERPHIHYHLLVDKTIIDPKNPSVHRQTWVNGFYKKTGINLPSDLKDVSSGKIEPLDKDKGAVYKIFSYPLKEKKPLDIKFYCFNHQNMSEEILEFLMFEGNKLFNEQRTDELNKKKREQKTQTLYDSLYDLTKEKNFLNIEDFTLYLQQNYMDRLIGNAKPAYPDYQKAVFKLADELKIYTYATHLNKYFR